TRRSDSIRQGCQSAGVFKWIARSDQPPDAIELESLESEQGCAEMRLVRRIERSAKQTDSHAGRVRRQQALENTNVRGVHGRGRPLPWIRYLKVVSWSTPTGPRACMRPVAMPISAPKPNSPPSANCVDALCNTIAESTSRRNLSAACWSSVMMASV